MSAFFASYPAPATSVSIVIPPVTPVTPINTTASYVQGTVSAGTTIPAPLNAVAFTIEALDTNDASIRFCVGGAASPTTGLQLQPGRDFTINSGLDISLCPESGNQTYLIQWVGQ